MSHNNNPSVQQLYLPNSDASGYCSSTVVVWTTILGVGAAGSSPDTPMVGTPLGFLVEICKLNPKLLHDHKRKSHCNRVVINRSLYILIDVNVRSVTQ